MRIVGDDLTRLLSKVEIDERGCWLWTAARSSAGYGNMYVGGRYLGAHRAAYTLLVGPVPEGLQLDHLCRVRHCVNPAHLEPVTHREKGLRGVGVSAINVRKTHCLRGHPFDEANTYHRRDRVGRGCRRCRAEAMQRFHRRHHDGNSGDGQPWTQREG